MKLVSCLNARMTFAWQTPLLLLGFGIFSSTSFAQVQSVTMPGYLADYHYQVANVTQDEAQAAMKSERTDFQRDSVCADRAELWTYVMQDKFNISPGKVFIHFTDEGLPKEDKQWAYHVAPYVIVDGEEMVLDSGFSVFKGRPVKLTEWMKYFGKSDACKVLDPTHNKADLALEQNNLPFDQDESGNPLTPLNYTDGAARQYPATDGAICYVRKVSPVYRYPKDVYAADLALSGQHVYDKFLMKTFDKDEVSFSCNGVISRWRAKAIAGECSKYLGF